MIKFLKDYFWLIIGAIVVLAVVVLLRDMDRAEELKSFFRRKRVEEEVDELKRKLAIEDAEAEANESKLVAMAEEYKKNKAKVEDASDEEVRDFYDSLFNK